MRQLQLWFARMPVHNKNFGVGRVVAKATGWVNFETVFTGNGASAVIQMQQTSVGKLFRSFFPV